MSQVDATVATVIRAPRSAVFEWFIPVELPRILLGYGPLPAVVRTTDQTGSWDQPGSGRIAHLADGNIAHEEVTVCERPRYFAYRVSDFTNVLRFLVREAEGQWWFEEDTDGVTKVKWTYTFYARSPLAKLALFPTVKLLWSGYMRVAMEATREQAEAEAT